MAASPLENAISYLRTHQVMTVATSGPEGLWAAAVFYVSKRFDLYFLSSAGARHVQNLEQNPRVAGTIQEDYSDWESIKGIQLEGPVQWLSGTERVDAIERYTEKFRFLRDAPMAIQVAFQKVNWYRITPDRLYFIDNSRGFGHRDRIL